MRLHVDGRWLLNIAPMIDQVPLPESLMNRCQTCASSNPLLCKLVHPRGIDERDIGAPKRMNRLPFWGECGNLNWFHCPETPETPDILNDVGNGMGIESS